MIRVAIVTKSGRSFDSEMASAEDRDDAVNLVGIAIDPAADGDFLFLDEGAVRVGEIESIKVYEIPER